MSGDRDTVYLIAGGRVTAVKAWSPEDEEVHIRSERAEQVRILPMVHGVCVIAQVGEIAIRVTLTREEFFFLLGGLAGMMGTVGRWLDEYDHGQHGTAHDRGDAGGA